MKRVLLSMAFAALMAGCASSVKLDNVPVEDRTGSAVNAGMGESGVSKVDSSMVGKSGLASSDLGKAEHDALMSATARTIYFDYDSFVIKPEYRTIIENQASYIKADKNRKVAVEGHTDERGGREYNLALGQKRAEAVQRALGLLGVSVAQVEAVSYGKEKPVAQGHDEASMAKNRRAEITYR